jgi:hypothetical protein
VWDEGLFHGSSLWWQLVDKLFHHPFLLNVEFFFLLLNVVSRLLPNGPLNLYINWKDGWIFGSKPLHELDEVLPGTAASVLLFRWFLELRSIIIIGTILSQTGTTRKIENTIFFIYYFYFLK